MHHRILLFANLAIGNIHGDFKAEAQISECWLSPFHKNLQWLAIKSSIASNKYADLSA
jgi:hypothetical protein